MSNWEQLGDWIATALVASFVWISGLASTGPPVGSPAAMVEAPAGTQLSSAMRWMQQENETPIEQVGEETDDDFELLDEAALPADELVTAEDVELLDQGQAADVQEDAELLDQGPPAIVAELAVPSSVATTPVTTYVAPAASSAPIIPEGFGTGDVHVVAGSAGFPVGLENCHVGAVTGRAYVGIDCGDENGSSFVGHAPSFEEFPFVVDENFPFDRGSVFGDQGGTRSQDDVVTLVSAARTATKDDTAAAPEIRTSGASSVEFEQRARGREPRVEAANGRAKRGKENRRNGSTDITVSESQDAAVNESTESTQKKKQNSKDRIRGGSAGQDEKKSKGSNNPKKNGGKKGKKNRATS